MPQTSVALDLLQSLKILTELGVNTVGQDLRVLAINDISLPVKEPDWDLVLSWVLDDGDNALKLFGSKLTGTLVKVDIGFLANQVGVSATYTFDFGEGIHDFLLSINVGVEETQDELKVRLLTGHERHAGQPLSRVECCCC